MQKNQVRSLLKTVQDASAHGEADLAAIRQAMQKARANVSDNIDDLQARLKELQTLHSVSTFFADPELESEAPFEALGNYLEAMVEDSDTTETFADELLALLGHNEPPQEPGSDTEIKFFVIEPATAELGDSGDAVLEPQNSSPASEKRIPVFVAEASIESDPEMLEVFAQETSDHLESVESLILEIETGEDTAASLDAIFRAFHTIKGTAGFFGFGGLKTLAHEIETLLDTVRKGETEFTPPLASLVLEVRDALMQMSAEAIETQSDVAFPPDLIERVVLFENSADAAAPAEPTATNTNQPAAAKPAQSNTVRSEVVKVDASRLDSLVDLVGELVISHSIISESMHQVKNAPDRLMQGTKHLTSIARELQSLSTSLRMVPIKPVFQRMKRLVRDLSHQTGKQVEFQVNGEDTEVDKSLIDEIGDPLVHLIRNAIDHGLEETADRAAVGKPANGVLSLTATQRGSWILVELRDDGRGLNAEKILAKAIERGVVEPNADLPDKKIFELILQPGFSTADKVSDVSGRGVGMDVVNQAIENLKGQLDITSEPGKGTTFTMRLPLTLAIIDGVVAQVSDERYIIPSASVVQTISTEGYANTTIAGDEEVVVYRSEAMPLVRLRELFDVPSNQEEPEHPLMMIIDNENQRFALMVDDLVGKQQVVIKSLDMLLKDTPGIAGSAIMPDGSVGLILDVEMLTRDLVQQIESMAVA